MKSSVKIILFVTIIFAIFTCQVNASEVTTIAVMPFTNISKNPQIDWIGAGFAETISTKLCEVSGIQYVERGQLSHAIKELKLQNSGLVDSATARKLGKMAGAGHVIIGSYQKSGDKLKVDARVVEVETATAGKSAEVVGKIDDVFDMQSDLTGKLVEAIGSRATSDETKAIDEAPAKSLKAYQWFAKGLDYQNKAKPAQAIQAYTEAVRLDPKYSDAYLNRGNVYREKEDCVKAVADYNKAIKITPDFALAYNNRGYTYYCLKEMDKALLDYNKAIDLDSGMPMTFNNRGILYFVKGNHDNSILDYNRAIALNPDFADAYYNRGITYAAMGDNDNAILDYTRTIDIKPDYADAYYNRGNSYSAKNDNDNAILDFTKAIKLVPENADAYNNRGNAFFAKGDIGKAISDYNKVIGINPKYAYAYYGRAQVYASKNEKVKAISDYREFLALASPNDNEWIDLAKTKISEFEK